MTAADEDLPLPNPQALGLRMSSAAYARLLAWLQAERSVTRAWVYGSRLTGRRREPLKEDPPDVDIVVEAAADPDDATTEWFRLRESIGKISTVEERFHLEFDEEGSQVRAWRADGVLIFQR